MCEWHEDSQNLSFPENHPRHLKRPYGHGELVADGLVHVAAILAGIVGMTTLFRLVAIRGGIAEGLAIAVYAAGFFSMFGFSLAYNMTPPSPLKWLLRRFDHSSIYLMIAGTYTPLLYQLQSRTWAWALAIVVWVGAIAGVVLKVALPGRFDRLRDNASVTATPPRPCRSGSRRAAFRDPVANKPYAPAPATQPAMNHRIGVRL